MEHNIRIPSDVYFILNRLCERGHTAHIVGGCVRDMLIGIEPGDYDITTSATPEETKAAFSEFRTVDTGIKHGTVTLIYGGAPYEITTYRTEGAYTDNRHPDSVSFTRTLELDLSRRDFTVNAMCADKDGRLTDLFCGLEHIRLGVISAVGCAKERFSEDALRILRAIRFSATLGFQLDGQTAAAARECSHLLKNISAERIYTEIHKLFSGKFAYRVISEYGDIIKAVIPELSAISLPPEDRFSAAGGGARLVSLFVCGVDNPPQAFVDAMRALRTDTATRNRGAIALEYINYPIETEADALRLLYSVGGEQADFVAELKALVFGETLAAELISRAAASGVPYKIADMAVGGEAFVAEGFGGKRIGEAMQSALFAIIDGKIGNNEAEIRSFIKELKTWEM